MIRPYLELDSLYKLALTGRSMQGVLPMWRSTNLTTALERMYATERHLWSGGLALSRLARSPLTDWAIRLSADRSLLQSWASRHIAFAQITDHALRARLPLVEPLSWSAMARVERALITTEALLRGVPPFHSAFADLLRFSDGYLAFVNKRLRRIATHDGPDSGEESSVTEAALRCADIMFIQSSAVLERTLTDEEEDTPRPDDWGLSARYNLFSVLGRHLGPHYARGSVAHLDVSTLPPARIHDLGCRLFDFVHRIYELHPPIFKLSGRTWRAALAVPNFVVESEEDFGTIVDWLYFTLYEATGSGKRLMDVVGEEETAALRVLRDLRLHFRHDVELGDGVARKQERIAQAFRVVSGVPRPQRVSEWKKAQEGLYGLLAEMLERILMKLAGSTREPGER